MYVCKLSIEDGNQALRWQSSRSETVPECAAYPTAAEVQGEALARLVRSPTFSRPLHALALAIADGDHDPRSMCPATEEAQERLIAAAKAVVAVWAEHDRELARIARRVAGNDEGRS